MRFRTVLFILLLVILWGSATLATVAGKFLALGNMPEWLKSSVELVTAHPWETFGVSALVTLVMTILKETWGKGGKSKGEDNQENVPDKFAGPKEPNFVHRHPLSPSFVGRLKERTDLTKWLLADADRLLVIWDTGVGGMGKSELAYAWVWEDVLGNKLPGALQSDEAREGEALVAEKARPVAILWYSFEQTQTSFGDFVEAALHYLEGTSRQELASIPMTDKIGRLIALLSNRNILVVLDAFERQLRAYLVNPDSNEDSRPLRACIDIHAEQFLQQASGLTGPGRILLTTRMISAALETADRKYLAGCRVMQLGGLGPADAVALFRENGVRGTDAEIQRACEPYGYHPLALRLLLGLILHDPENPGDIRSANSYSIPAEMRGRDKQHILEASYRSLAPNNRRLLSQIAAFRESIGYPVALRLNPYASEGPFKTALQELENRHLIRFNRETSKYDLHPIIRRYAYERLNSKEDTHRTIRDYYATFSVPNQESLRILEELHPVIEWSYHAAKAGLFDEACSVIEEDGRAEVLLHAFAGHEILYTLLIQLFPDGLNAEPRLQAWQAQAWAINLLAICSSRLGEEDSAIQLYQMTAQIASARSDRRSTAIALTNLSVCHIRLGLLDRARVQLEYALRLSVDQGPFVEAGIRAELGKFYWLAGEIEKATGQADAVHELAKEFDDRNMEAVCFADQAEAAVLYGNYERVENFVQRAKDTAAVVAESELLRHDWLLGCVKMHEALNSRLRRSKRLSQAEEHYASALNRATRNRLVEWEARVRLSFAQLHMLRRRWKQAQADLSEAMRIADRYGYRLIQADAFNVAGMIELAHGNWRRARELAVAAIERAKCDGPPNSYRRATEIGEKLLANTAGKARRAEWLQRWAARLGIRWLMAFISHQ